MSDTPVMTLLVIDDEDTIFHSLSAQFQAVGVSVLRAPCEDLSDVFLLQTNPSVVVIHATGSHGLELCRSIWARLSVPIVIACKDFTELCQLQGFAAGASDVMSSASSSELLAARIWARMKEVERQARGVQRHEVRTFHGLVVDDAARHVTCAGIPVPLTRIEFEILSLLMGDPERVFRRDEIIKAVWNSDWAGDAHMLESHVSRLRKKIAVCGGPHVAVAVRGVGYRLCEAPGLVGALPASMATRQAGGGSPVGLSRPAP